MANNINVFEWRSLTSAVSKIVPAQTFLLDKIFKTKMNYLTDKVDIEILSGSDKLAHFVNKGEDPALVGKMTRKNETVTLPRIYEKKIFTADELASFKSVGEVYVQGAADMVSAAESYKLQELANLQDRIVRRKEQMAALALTTGAISISQDNIALSYNYYFQAGADKQLVTLTGNYVWGGSSGDIVANIRSWSRNIFKKTGAAPTIGLLGTSAAAKFIADSTVQGMLDKNNLRMGALDLNQPVMGGAVYLGRVLGIDWYEYSCPYTDDSGTAQEAFAVGKCVLVAPDSSFRQHHGAIYRIEDSGTLTIKADQVVTPITDPYKTKLEWAIETKPLPAIHVPERVVAATVV